MSGINFRVSSGYLGRLSLESESDLSQPAEVVKEDKKYKLTFGVWTHVLHLGDIFYFENGVLVVEQKAEDGVSHLLVSVPSSEVLIEGHQLVGEVDVSAALNLVHLILC